MIRVQRFVAKYIIPYFPKFRTRDIGEENLNKHAVLLAFYGEIWHKSNNSDYLSKLGSMPCFNRA